MLFNEILKLKYDQLEPLFDKLFDLVIKNQTHPGDLLLTLENANLSETIIKNENNKGALHYNIGPGLDYHCETANHNFIKQYIRGVVDIPYEEYKSMHKFTPEPNHEIEEVLFVESNTIQLEMLIYLKIWEGETFLKKFYQLSRLINGQDYDWHLNISYGKKIFGSMERSEIIKQLKENLQKKFPDLFEIINRIHKSQIRNAIAHSQYAMVGRTIMLNNQRKDKLNSISSLKFDEWVEIFHDTITIYTLYEIFFEKVKEYYFELSKEFRLKREVRVNRYYPEPNKYLILLYTREHFKDWSPHTHT